MLDTSGFHSRYRLLAPRFTPHLSHLCTHKLASLTVLRIVNQKAEPEASQQVVDALFFSPNDHVLTDVLGDQINGVAVVHKILQSSYLDPGKKPEYLEATKRVLVDLKVATAQAYRRLIEEVGLPIPSYNNPTFPVSASGNGPQKKPQQPQPASQHGPHSMFSNQNVNSANPVGFGNENAPYDAPMTSIMASMQALQLQQQQFQAQAASTNVASNVNGMGLNPRQMNNAGLAMQNNMFVQALMDGFREVYGVNPTPEQVVGMVQRQQQNSIPLPLPAQGYAGRPSTLAPSGGVGPGLGLQQQQQQQRYGGSRVASGVQNMPQAGSGMMVDSARFETHVSPDLGHGNQMVRYRGVLLGSPVLTFMLHPSYMEHGHRSTCRTNRESLKTQTSAISIVGHIATEVSTLDRFWLLQNAGTSAMLFIH